MILSRRSFAGMLGVATLASGVKLAGAASSVLNEALSQVGAPTPKNVAAKVPLPAAKVAPETAKDPQSAEEVWADLAAGNKRFVANKPTSREYRTKRNELTKGQHPKVIVLGCADSRVSPELVFDKTLGELFVVRTAGNIADPVVLGSIEYAAEHFHPAVLLVLGHEKCGAVAAAASGEKMPTPGLEAIVNKIGPVTDRLKEFFEGDDLVNIAVQANVARSASDLLKSSPILRKEVAASKLSIMKAIYRLKSGEVVRIG